MTNKLNELRDALEAARKAEYQARQARHEEIRDMKAAVTERHQPIITGAQETLRKAQEALDQYNNNTASHPHEGETYYKVKKEYGYYGRAHTETVIRGVLEVCRIDTVFPKNQKYMRPSIGQPFIRLLKADGTPGLKFKNLDGWYLTVEEAKEYAR